MFQTNQHSLENKFIKEIYMRFIHCFILIITSCLFSASIFAENNITQNLPTESLQAVPPTSLSKPIPVNQKISLNKATAQELLMVKGLNTSKVRAIITYRKKNNGFKTLDELSQVKGMKRLKPDEIKGIQEQLKL
jgi:competence ComEA-like helix-hairpin-helix protein